MPLLKLPFHQQSSEAFGTRSVCQQHPGLKAPFAFQFHGEFLPQGRHLLHQAQVMGMLSILVCCAVFEHTNSKE